MQQQYPLGFSRFNLAAFMALITSLLPFASTSFQTSEQEAKETSQKNAKGATAGHDSSRDDDLPVPTLSNLTSRSVGIWGDPLEGVKTSNEPRKTECNADPAAYQRFLLESIGTSNRGKGLHILAVIVEGGELQSQRESRTNARHAVEHALAMEGFEMPFEDRMSYSKQTWTVCYGQQKVDFVAEVPMKFYTRKIATDLLNTDSAHKPRKTGSEGDDHLLVCWIDNRFLGDRKLQTLQGVLNGITGNELWSKSTLTIIGPTYSSELEKIALEVETSECAACVPSVPRENRRLISPSATSLPKESRLKALTTNWDFISTIRSDEELAEELTNEIQLRRRQHGQVVVVSESGASSPAGIAGLLATNLQAIGAAKPIRLEYLKYLGQPQSDSGEKSSVDDYFQRQLTSIRQGYFNIRRDDVSAVIVVGNHVQDKLAMIKNLRQEFPNATFFTHDLDHRFFQLQNLPFCRGLVTVSRGDLVAPVSLFPNDNSPEEEDAPAIVFREIYQTSTYQAARLAVTNRVGEFKPPKVTRHEIGYTGPNALTAPISEPRLIKLLCMLFGIALTVSALTSLKSPLALWTSPGPAWQWIKVEIGRLLSSLSPWNASRWFPKEESARSVEDHKPKEWVDGLRNIEGVDSKALGVLKTNWATASSEHNDWSLARTVVRLEESSRRREEGIIFSHLFNLRAEVSLAAVSAALVWRSDFWSGNVIDGPGILFGLLLILMLIMGVLAVFPSGGKPQTGSVKKSSSNRRQSPATKGKRGEEFVRLYYLLGGGRGGRSGYRLHDYLFFQLFVIGMVALAVFCVYTDCRRSGMVLHEPIQLFSGISIWPVLVSYVILVCFAVCWLEKFGNQELAFDSSSSSLETLIPTGKERPLAQWSCGKFFYFDMKAIGDYLLNDGEVTDEELHKTFRQGSASKTMTVARVAMFGLLIVFFVWELPGRQTLAEFPNWGLVPLPPARGGIELAAGMFLGTLALFLSLLVSLISLIQVMSFARFIRGLRHQWSNQKVDSSELATKSYIACDFVQNASYSVMKNAVWYPSLMLLGFAFCRFPVIESWTLNSSILISIAGIPVFFALTSAVLLRMQCQRFREETIRRLNEQETAKGGVRLRSICSGIRDRIEAMHKGAFGSVWNDPVLGSFFFFATAILSSPGADFLKHLGNFLA